MELTVSSENDMKRRGEQLATVLKGGDCIELIGDVGSGKTTLTKGIARGLGVTDTVQSPTFTINRTYDCANGLKLNHYDFYRLNDPGIMANELEETLMDRQSVIVVEWGEIVASVLPPTSIRITFQSPSETERVLHIETTNKETRSRLMQVFI